MTHEPIPESAQDKELQDVFDETAAHPTEAQLERMIARAEQIPARSRRRPTRWRTALWLPIAAAAAVTLAIGGAWWARQSTEAPAVASAPSTQTSAPTSAPPTAVVSGTPVEEWDEDPITAPMESPAGLPDDPLAVLEEDLEDSGEGMTELDLLHGPSDDDAFWEELERLMEEDG